MKKTLPCMNTTKNPPSGDQGLAFQTHALQMILFGPFYVRTQYSYGSLQNRVLTIYIYIYIYINFIISLENNFRDLINGGNQLP